MWFIRLRKKLFEFIRFSVSGKKRKCLILGTPAHKNLGDHAIVYAQYKYIRDKYSDCDIMEMSRLEYDTYKKIVKLITPKNTLIVVDGGGNLGTLWPVEDGCIRDIVGRFTNNPVIVFPQTAYYADTAEGKALYEKTVALLNSREKLLFMFRDDVSYSMFKNRVKSDKILLCPDIVTYVDDASDNAKPVNGKVGICFRDDKETVMDSEERKKIRDYIESAGCECTEISTISPVNIHEEERNKTLLEKWAQFAKCDLIVTDRLHGMIFSAITGTSCVAFDNVSKKVQGGYRWLSDLEYVKYCDGYDTFCDMFSSLSGKGKHIYNRETVNGEHYAALEQFISKCR